jgi:hypothetical protein
MAVMPALLPLAVAVAMTVLVAQFYDLRRLDDAFVSAFLFMTALWVVGAGLGPAFPRFPQLSAITSAMLLAGYVALGIGGIAGAMARSRRPSSIARYDELRPTTTGRGAVHDLAALMLGYLLVAAFIYIVGGVPVLSPDGEQARVDARAGLGYVVIAAIWLITFSTTAMVAHAYRSRGSHHHLIWLPVLISAIALAGLGNRAPVLVLLIACGWVAYTAKGTVPPWRFLVAGGAMALLALVLFGILRGGDAPSVDLLGRLQWQFYVNGSNLERLTQLIPDRVGYLWGESYLIDLAVLLPGSQPNFGTWLKETIGMQFPGGGITIGLLGELYANWGPIVAGTGALIAGYLFSLFRPALRLRQPSDAAFVVLGSLALGGMIQSGVMSVLLYSVVPLVIVYAAGRALELWSPSTVAAVNEDGQRGEPIRDL